MTPCTRYKVEWSVICINCTCICLGASRDVPALFEIHCCPVFVDAFIADFCFIFQDEKSAAVQFCKKCLPEQRFTSFEDLLRHNRSYHRKVVKVQTATVVTAGATAENASSEKGAKGEAGETRPHGLKIDLN